jgi:hypothetical protein
VVCASSISLQSYEASAESPGRYESPEHGYSVAIPAGWKKIPQEVVKETFGRVIKPGQVFKFEAAFEPKSNPTAFSGPYMLLQVTPYENLGGEQPNALEIRAILREMGTVDILEETEKSMTEEGKLHLRGAKVGEVDYDPTTRTYATRIDLDSTTGAMRTQVQGRFGHLAMVQLNFYSPTSSWASNRPAYEQVAGTIEFSDEAAYKDDIWTSFPDVLRSVLIVGGLGLLVGLLALLFERARD